MTQANYQPASVLDIASFGYRTVAKHVIPLTKLSVVFVFIHALIQGVTMGAMQMAKNGDSVGFSVAALVGYGMLAIGGMVIWYLHYPVMRYVRDFYFQEQPTQNVFGYLVPQIDFLGILLFVLIMGAATIPLFCVIGLIYGAASVFLVLVPFVGIIVWLVVVFFLIVAWCCFLFLFTLLIATYMTHPEKGVIAAIEETWNNLSDNFWRTIVLACTVTLVEIVITFPLMAINAVAGMLMSTNPSLSASIPYVLLYAFLYGISQWFHMVFAVGGSYFAVYRYLIDIRGRREETSPLSIVPKGMST